MKLFQAAAFYLFLGLIPAFAGTITQIQVPGSTFTLAMGINNAGQIVGAYGLPGQVNPVISHGFLLSNGLYTTIDVPGAISTTLSDINNAGTIVGYYTDSLGELHGFTLSGNTYTFLGFPALVNEFYSSGINDSGQVIGQTLPTGSNGAYLYQGGMYQLLPVTDLDSSRVGINNAGTIAGTGRIPGGFSCRIYDGVTVTDFQVPGSGPNFTNCQGINNLGQIVGTYTVGGAPYAFMLTGSSVFTLPLPSSALPTPSDINDVGQIVGSAFPSAMSPGQGFLFDPVPEPSTISMLGLGIAAVFAIRVRAGRRAIGM